MLVEYSLAKVRFLSDHVSVMYAGRIVEEGPLPGMFSRRAHPCAAALIEASRRTRPDDVVAPRLAAEAIPTTGFAFRPRCRRAEARYCLEAPMLRELGSVQRAACHLI